MGLAADLAADLAGVFLAALEGALTLTIFRGALTAGLAVVGALNLALVVLGFEELAEDFAEVFAADWVAGLAVVLLTALAAVLPAGLVAVLVAVLVAGFATAFLALERPGIWAFTGSGSTRLGALPA
jgi:hypothetical protein